jgi:hypothetical protein
VPTHLGLRRAPPAAGSAYELELSRELTSRGVCDFNGTWSTADHWTQNFTAHPKVCPQTGELVYIGYNLVPAGGPPTVTVGVVAPSGGVVHRATLPVARPSMQHDMVRCAMRDAHPCGARLFARRCGALRAYLRAAGHHEHAHGAGGWPPCV